MWSPGNPISATSSRRRFLIEIGTEPAVGAHRIPQRERVLREERLRRRHVQAAVRARDHPVDPDHGAWTYLLAAVGEREPAGLDAPEPRVLERRAALRSHQRSEAPRRPQPRSSRHGSFAYEFLGDRCEDRTRFWSRTTDPRQQSRSLGLHAAVSRAVAAQTHTPNPLQVTDLTRPVAAAVCSIGMIPSLAPTVLKAPNRPVQVVPRVAGRDLASYARLALRHHRKAEAGDEHALVEQHVAHPDRRRRLADDDRHDRRLARKRLESRFGDLLAEIARVLPAASRTRSGCSSRSRTAASALIATVGGSAFENSCGRERCVR